MFSIIVAIGKNNEIGKKNKLIWHIPEDLKNFKKITTGKTVVMGRKTHESIGKALPNRKNIILTRNFNIKHDENIEVYNDLENFIDKYKNNNEEIFIIGGEEIYKQFIDKDLIDYLYISEIKKIYGTHLSKIILYGSYARGDFRPDSDVDIMILLDLSDLDLKKYSKELSYMTYDFNLDNDIDIKPIAKSESHFKKWVVNYPFYENVNKEGVVLYGAV